MTTLLAALLSGMMFYLSQGRDNVWALAWFAPAPLLWLAYGTTRLWKVVLASLAAILAGAIYVLQCYYGLVPPLILLQVIVPQAALFPLAVIVARAVQRRATPLITLFAFPACWTTLEYLSQAAAPNGTYGAFAYSQVSAPLLIQGASLFGMYAVTFLICLFANTLALGLRERRRAALAIGVGAAICAANIVFGMVRLAQPQPATVRVAALVDETAKVNAWHARTQTAAVSVAYTYAGDIRRATAQGARFIVTSEGGMVATAQLLPAILAPLIAVSQQTSSQIVAGVVQNQPAANLAFSILPDGTAQRYDKRHLVPILEDRFTPGHRAGWLGDGRAVEICKDMDFQRTVRLDAAKGVRLMGVPAADFGKDAWLHARMAVMRGVENGFALVRAADNGLVTASDAQGRLIASKMDTRPGLTMVVADLPLGPGPTLYARIGDAFVWLCAAFLLWIGADFFCKRHEQRGRPLPESEALGVHEFGEWPFAGILERDGPDHHHCREHGR